MIYFPVFMSVVVSCRMDGDGGAKGAQMEKISTPYRFKFTVVNISKF